MSALLKTVVEGPANAGAEDIVHEWCCDDSVALCGADITDEPIVPDPSPQEMCVVCVDLYEADCSVTCRAPH